MVRTKGAILNLHPLHSELQHCTANMHPFIKVSRWVSFPAQTGLHSLEHLTVLVHSQSISPFTIAANAPAVRKIQKVNSTSHKKKLAFLEIPLFYLIKILTRAASWTSANESNKEKLDSKIMSIIYQIASCWERVNAFISLKENVFI